MDKSSHQIEILLFWCLRWGGGVWRWLTPERTFNKGWTRPTLPTFIDVFCLSVQGRFSTKGNTDVRMMLMDACRLSLGWNGSIQSIRWVPKDSLTGRQPRDLQSMKYCWPGAVSDRLIYSLKSLRTLTSSREKMWYCHPTWVWIILDSGEFLSDRLSVVVQFEVTTPDESPEQSTIWLSEDQMGFTDFLQLVVNR